MKSLVTDAAKGSLPLSRGSLPGSLIVPIDTRERELKLSFDLRTLFRLIGHGCSGESARHVRPATAG
jgi:hypothetical protein